MGDALQNWLHLFFGSKNEVAVINDKVKCPSGGTISRARPKVDVGLDLELVEDLLFFLDLLVSPSYSSGSRSASVVGFSSSSSVSCSSTCCGLSFGCHQGHSLPRCHQASHQHSLSSQLVEVLPHLTMGTGVCSEAESISQRPHLHNRHLVSHHSLRVPGHGEGIQF